VLLFLFHFSLGEHALAIQAAAEDELFDQN
jgi:hypothetical protein